MTALTLPKLSANPARLHRSGLRWLQQSGAELEAREPLAACYIRIAAPSGARVPLPEEQNDIQVVLAPEQAGVVTCRDGLSLGGYRDLVESGSWQPGEVVADTPSDDAKLAAMVLVGRRGFECGEGRGQLLAGWHEKVRASWEGPGGPRFGQVLALGTCEQNAIFRGDDTAFLSWFARAPGPVQISAVSDERCVHSSAVLLQHVRRTPAEAAAIADAVLGWVHGRATGASQAAFPAFEPEAARGILQGRWPHAQEIAFAVHLLAEVVGTSPILERTEVISSRGTVEVAPPDVVALSLASELALHYRHRKTGWIIALHGFRIGPFMGPGIVEWLRRDFEPVRRSVEDTRRDLAALADEIQSRTGGHLLVQNLIASNATDRVSNYSWLGDAFAESLPVASAELNLMLHDLSRRHTVAVLDSDALTVDLGVNQCPDRFHGSRDLVEAQRAEVHRFLRYQKIPGF